MGCGSSRDAGTSNLNDTAGDASAKSGPSTSDGTSVPAQLEIPSAPERVPGSDSIRNKIVDGMRIETDERKYAFAIGGDNIDMQKILADEVGIFGIITFSGASSDSLKTVVKDAFDGLMKYEFMKDRKYASVFSDVQVVLLEQVRTAPEYVGQITATLVVCDNGELLILSPDAQTRMKTVSEEGKGGAVEIRDVKGDGNDNHCYLGPSAGKHNCPLTKTFALTHTDSFLIIDNGFDGVTDTRLNELIIANVPRAQEQTIQDLANSIYSVGTGSPKVIVVDLRQTD